MDVYLVIPFAIIIIVLLLLDLGVFHKNAHAISNKEAGIWSTVWIGLGLLFGLYIGYQYGEQDAYDYYSAFLIEKALSVDNLFVFVLVFRYFKVPAIHQHKVLFWGVLGAIILRGIFIFSGVWLVNATYLPEAELFGKLVSINPVLSIFGAFLIYAGIKSGLPEKGDEPKDFSKNFLVRTLKKNFKFTEEFHGDKFTVVKNGIKFATPLVLVVAVIELTDLVFAVDSIPAIFAITDNPLILYTSNIFAIFGLRSLYFLLANSIDRFYLLSYSLAVILTFIGVKMLITPWIHLPSVISLTIVASCLLIGVVGSLLFPKQD